MANSPLAKAKTRWRWTAGPSPPRSEKSRLQLTAAAYDAGHVIPRHQHLLKALDGICKSQSNEYLISFLEYLEVFLQSPWRTADSLDRHRARADDPCQGRSWCQLLLRNREWYEMALGCVALTLCDLNLKNSSRVDLPKKVAELYCCSRIS